MLVLLDGPRLLDRDGTVIAELAPDGHWYTGAGAECRGLSLPMGEGASRAPRERTETVRRADALWMTEAMQALGLLAYTHAVFTSDELWAELEKPPKKLPRESRMIGNAFTRARAAGVIEPTHDHRPSGRKENHGRPVRVWRSLRYGQQAL
jgi:hypothetical protein